MCNQIQQKQFDVQDTLLDVQHHRLKFDDLMTSGPWTGAEKERFATMEVGETENLGVIGFEVRREV